MRPRFATPPTPEREVACCWCGHDFRVPRKAESVVCPGCYKRALVADVIVRTKHTVGSIATCGRFVVEKRGLATPGKVVAGAGVEVFGTLDATVETPGSLIVGPKGVLRGRVRAASILIEPGGDVRDADMTIGTPPAEAARRETVSAALAGPARETLPEPKIQPKPTPPKPPATTPEASPKTPPRDPALSPEPKPSPSKVFGAPASGGDSTRVTRGGTVRLRIG
ncbi:MAG: polymer-forming cytoskeletal protein [Phycisphaerales bacterium]|nr:MAG: polymer-forming cytoskeletal protein [Phycisphaerales bacterium]